MVKNFLTWEGNKNPDLGSPENSKKDEDKETYKKTHYNYIVKS